MLRRTINLLLLLSGGALFFSCENQAFLPPYESVQSGEVSASIRTGDILFDGQMIQLSLNIDRGSENPPQKLEIEVLDGENGSLGVQVLSGNELEDPIPGVSISEEQRGLHTLHIRLFDQQDEVMQEQRIPFFKVDSIPEIQRIDVYPPDAVSPQASGVLVPRVKNGGGTWFRWTMEDELLDRGPYADFRTGFVWTAPMQEGVYSVTLEIFPEAPADPEAGFPFDSAISSEVQFFVQDRIVQIPTELNPASAYQHLLHLRGSLEDEGTAGDDIDIGLEGNPYPAVKDGVFGYRFSSSDALLVPEVSLFDPITGNPDPFSIILIGKFDFDDFTERHILSFLNPAGRQMLSLLTDDAGSPQLILPQLAGRRISNNDFSITSVSELALSFNQIGNSLQVRWYCDGRRVNSFLLPESLFPKLDDVVLQVGGSPGDARGFDGLLDELGIFTSDESGEKSSDTDIFGSWARRTLGERMVLYAEGFESERDDSIRIEAGERVLLTEIPAEWPLAVVNVSLVNEDKVVDGMFSLNGDDGYKEEIPIQSLMHDSVPGRVEQGEQAGFLVQRSGGFCSISDLDGNEIIRSELWAAAGMELYAVSSAAGKGMRIDEILITKERSPFTMNRDLSNDKVAVTLKQ